MHPCPVCHSQEFKPALGPIKRCGGCGLGMVNPLGEFRGENETEEYFLREYLPLQLANYENSMAERQAHLATIQRHFALPARPRLLDVGCALGLSSDDGERRDAGRGCGVTR